MIGNTPIQRLHTGTLWAEGPAWNGVGRYLVWSDIPNNVQMRWLEEDGHVTVFRNPSGNSNGNTFDYEGRQLSCEHGNRRVVRYEQNGTVTVLADKFQGKRLNSPNDIVVHPDGGIWFTDPGLRHSMATTKGTRANSEIKEAVYRIDRKTGQMDKVTDEIGQAERPLLLARLQEAVHRRHRHAARDHRLRRGRQRRCATASASSSARYSRAPERPSAADGIRCDIDGNIWAGARPGVQVIAPDGERIGMILLPEICANVCFGGAKRNRLFMAASQSLYAVYVETTGAHIA